MTERKTFRHVEVKDAAEGSVRAVFSTFDVVDADGDVVKPGAFTDGAKVRISAFNHGSWQGGQLPVGKGTIRTTDREAILEGRFFLSTTAGRETWETVRELGELGEWSYSLRNVKSSRGGHNGQRVRFIESVDVHEVSPVIQGASVDTRTLSVKNRDDGLPPGVDLELRQIRKANTLAMAKQALRRSGELLQKIELDQLARDFYTYSATDDVHPEIRKAAEVTVKAASADLGIDPPRLRFFRRETADERRYVDRWGHRDWPTIDATRAILGQARRDEHEVWVRADLDVWDAVSTAAHEVRHIAQPTDLDAQARERDAREYERNWTPNGEDTR